MTIGHAHVFFPCRHGTGCPKKKLVLEFRLGRKTSNRLQIFFIYPTWVEENCKKFSDQNTVCNIVKIQFEKYEKIEKIQNF